MNILTYTQRNVSAKFLAAMTIVSMILSAFPVAFFVANAAVPVVLFSDSFENVPAFSSPAWTNSPKWSTSAQNAHTGTRKAKVEGSANGAAVLETSIDATGHDGLTLSFWYRLDDFEANNNDRVVVDWYDGTTWNSLVTLNGADVDVWTEWSGPLGAGADDNSALVLRFRAFLDAGNDKFYLDDVSVGGDVIPDPTCDDGIQNQDETGIDEGGVCTPLPVLGCTDENATNYNELATEEDGSCEYPEPERCENLLINGSFEDDEVTNGSKWQKFASVTGWLVEKVSDDSPTTLELMEEWSGNEAAHGDQYAELDGDHSTKILQTVATIPGAVYELKWAFAPRHDITAEQNQLSVMVEGSEVATEGPDTGSAGLDSSDWTRGSYEFTADDSTDIAFADAGPSNSFGTFLDDAQLCLVRKPEPVANIHTSKIVCTDEADLPNGSITRPISASTAEDWVETHSSCELVKGWEFEWGPKNSSDPGDTLVGSAGGDWTTFTGSIAIPESELQSHLWMREVLQDDYITFTHGPEGNKNTDDYTAELYCHTDAKNYDNFDRIDNPEAGNDYYCVAWNVPTEKTSDVTICKYDEEQNPLAGWQLSLLGEEVDSIAVQSDGTTQSLLGVPVGDYVLKAEGAYKYRGGTALEADARFSERKAGDPGYGTYPDQPWREASAVTGGLAVQVNSDLGVLWGSTFSPSHVYYGTLSQAVLGDVDFYIYDNVYTDNSGEIDVTLYNGQTGITGENGCVTFDDVPYGEYDIEELLQTDWENISGLGSVVVDEDPEIFTVVNKDLDKEPVFCTLKLTSDDTNTVEEKEGAFATVLSFVHEAWTESLLNADWIWGDDGPTDPSQEETQTFSNKFGWGGATIVDATLTIAADNSFSASINGDLAGEDLTEFNFASTKDYDVASLIDNGNNELLVEVTNFAGSASRKSNPAGLYYELVITGEGEDCGVPYVPEPEEPEYGPYCGDGEINQLWEQCDGDDVEEGQSCTDYCTLDNQCSAEQLVKITLDETDSTSFDGSLHLDMAGNIIPNGTWFSFGEFVGNDSFATIANAVDGLAVKRDTVNNKLALAFVGGNSSTHNDIVAGTIMTKGIDLGSVDRTPNPQFKLEDGSGNSFDDVFDKNPDQSIDFDLRADTGNDGVTVEIGQGEEYDCPECKAEVEARIVVRDEDGAEVTNGGLGNLTETVILGDGTEVPFGTWFKLSEANPGPSATWIDDEDTVTNYDNPGDLEGLFVSREGNGKVKVALYGYHNPGGDTNFESLRATIEFNDAKVLGGSTTQIPGDFKLENHSEGDNVNSNDNFDTFEEAVDLMSVDFDFWVDTKADGITITLDSDEIDSCEEDDDPQDPEVPMTHRIEGTKYVMAGDNSVPYEGWRIYATNGDQDPLSTTTDEYGDYYFDVGPGNWVISEEMPEGWSQVQVRQYDFIQLTTDEPLTCEFTIINDEFVKYLRISDVFNDESQQDESYGYECDFYNELEESVDPEEPTKPSSESTQTDHFRRAGQVLGASTDFCPFLVEYMQIGASNNNPVEVTKLQLFLNVFKDMFGGTENPVNGVFGQTTDANVKAFQEHFRTEILDPWFNLGIVPHNRPTGFVYKTTLWKINSIVCPDYAVLPNFDGEDLTTNIDIDSN